MNCHRELVALFQVRQLQKGYIEDDPVVPAFASDIYGVSISISGDTFVTSNSANTVGVLETALLRN